MDGLYDCVIVGGGPAGLSAALVLGRCRRRVLVLDAGHPRNERSAAAHGVFTRDGETPAELVRIARAQLVPYDVRVVDDEVLDVAHDASAAGFRTTTKAGAVVLSRKVLLATGMRDRLPGPPELRERYGRGVFVCPYCDGWEVQDEKIVAYAPADKGPDLALALRTWSKDIVLVTAGETIDAASLERLERNDVPVFQEKIASLECAADGERLRAVVLDSGARIPCAAVFVQFGEEQASPLAARLGCELTESGTVRPRDGERAGPPGLFVAGDASHDFQLIPIAVAEGLKAACAINTELRRESER